MDIFLILFLVVSKLQIIVTDGSKWSSSPKRKCSSYCQVCREMSFEDMSLLLMDICILFI